MAAKPEESAIREALATVNDPEINRPITEIGMLKSVDIRKEVSSRSVST